VGQVRQIASFDWNRRANAQAKINVMVMKVPRKHRDPTNLQEGAEKMIPK
jgi:hypothetical protein